MHGHAGVGCRVITEHDGVDQQCQEQLLIGGCDSTEDRAGVVVANRGIRGPLGEGARGEGEDGEEDFEDGCHLEVWPMMVTEVLAVSASGLIKKKKVV